MGELYVFSCIQYVENSSRGKKCSFQEKLSVCLVIDEIAARGKITVKTTLTSFW